MEATMLLRELFEDSKTAVVTFGRMNPPTIGHAKLIQNLKSHDGDQYVFLSHTQNKKDNPLDYDTKVNFFKKFFPGVNVGHESVRTVVDAMKHIQNLGYESVTFVVGEDRVDSFDSMLTQYNGSPNKQGEIPYSFKSLNVISAGQRDPDSDGVEGMSASKMRDAAKNNDFDSFREGTPDPAYAKELFNQVRKGMGIVTETTEREITEGITEQTEIYVDMDGVLADFFGEWAKLVGVKHFKDIDNKMDVEAALQLIRDSERFWLDLPMLDNAKDLLGIIKRIKGEYHILSSPLANDPRSEPYKKIWVKENLGFFPPKSVIITHDKAKHATQADGTPNILIDDYGINIKKWESAGGIGFKHKDHKFERTVDSFKDKFNYKAPGDQSEP
jgi:5'(3')-deoxyribonucleotidase